MKSFELNKLFIIESLEPSHRNGVYDKPAKELKDAMDKEKLLCDLITIDGDQEFYQKMLMIKEECKKGIKPIIHFVCHGYCIDDKSPAIGMAIWNSNKKGYDLIPWREVENYLESINEACQVNLFVTLSVCKAFIESLSHILDDGHRIPFCGIIASPDPVKVNTSFQYFTTFYIELIKTQDVGKAYSEAQKLLDNLNKLYIAHNLDPERQILMFSDELFTRAAKGDFSINRSKPYQVRKLAIKEIEREFNLKKKHIPEFLIRRFIGKNYELLWSIHKEMQDFKFMLDIFPTQRQRFELPQNIKDLHN